jgi:hypothetical protein
MNYQKIYNQIIENAKNKKVVGYFEKHHIIPKCLGGNNDNENLVKLTAREHFLCHLLLCEIYPENHDLKYAAFLMSINKNKKNNRYKINSRLYERLKIEFQLVAKGRPKPEGFGERIINAERNAKIGLANRKPKPKGFGKNPNQNHKACKPVLQYDLNGNFIREWSRSIDAQNELGIWKESIRAVARGVNGNKTAGGYIWRYKNDPLPIDLEYIQRKKETKTRIYKKRKSRIYDNDFYAPIHIYELTHTNINILSKEMKVKKNTLLKIVKWQQSKLNSTPQ